MTVKFTIGVIMGFTFSSFEAQGRINFRYNLLKAYQIKVIITSQEGFHSVEKSLHRNKAGK